MSMRSGASVNQDFAVSWVPVGARTTLGLLSVMLSPKLS